MAKTCLITGGAGFVGSNLAARLKEQYAEWRVVAFDNLRRRGSELNLPFLKKKGVEFVHGDVRCPGDLTDLGKVDFLIECSAEPSVLAGFGGSPDYVVHTNLTGAIHCLELARQNGCPFLFLSTSRVYPHDKIGALEFSEIQNRFEFSDKKPVFGVSPEGISEDFDLRGLRSLYGATKLSVEYLLMEYADMYGFPGIINRCGVIAGPRQMGKTDQGIMALWVAAHVYGDSLSYIGYGGKGKQVRDVLHIEDLCDLVLLQFSQPEKFTRRIFNVGGGLKNSVSLLELTTLCRDVSGCEVKISSEAQTRPADLPWYVTDHRGLTRHCGWSPKRSVAEVVRDIYGWMVAEKEILRPILARR